MNILFWVLQSLLAFHTIAGAVWKFSNPEQTVPSLQAIPHGLWLSMSGIELLCAVGLILPALNKSLATLIPIAAVCIAAEMLIFCAVHVYSGGGSFNQPVYWLVVAGICAFIAYGRLALKPL
jgi:hypothetical protein